jgi:Uma2 family endonuclease
MSAVLQSNNRPAVRIRPISVDEFHAMGEAGVFAPEERIELIEGELAEMAPIGTRHAACVNKLNDLLVHAVAGRAVVSIQNPVVLSELSEPQPDLAVLRFRDDYYAGAHPRPEDILLVVEVADSSVNYDRNVKIPLYARCAVPEAWLVDLGEDRLEAYRDPADGEYRRVEYYRRGAAIPMQLPDVEIPVRSLFPPPP